MLLKIYFYLSFIVCLTFGNFLTYTSYNMLQPGGVSDLGLAAGPVIVFTGLLTFVTNMNGLGASIVAHNTKLVSWAQVAIFLCATPIIFILISITKAFIK